MTKSLEPQTADNYVPDKETFLKGPGISMIVSHQLSNGSARGGTFWLYDDLGFARRCQLGLQSDGTPVLPSNLHPACPLCAGFHPASEFNPNACPKREPVRVSECPICKRSLYELAGPIETLVQHHMETYHYDSVHKYALPVTIYDPIQAVEDAFVVKERKLKL